MEDDFNINPSQQYKISRNPNYRKQINNYEKNKMHSQAIGVMNLISLFNTSSNENNNNISASNVLSKIKSINDPEMVNKDEFNEENNNFNYINQLGGNLDKGGISQTMIINSNGYPGRSILDKYNYYYQQLKGENPLEETAIRNFSNNNINNNNNDQINDSKIIKQKIIYKDNINDFNSSFDGNNNNRYPLQGRNNNNNNNINNYGNFNDNFSNNFNNNKQTIVQYNDYIVRDNNSNKYA